MNSSIITAALASLGQAGNRKHKTRHGGERERTRMLRIFHSTKHGKKTDCTTQQRPLPSDCRDHWAAEQVLPHRQGSAADDSSSCARQTASAGCNHRNIGTKTAYYATNQPENILQRPTVKKTTACRMRTIQTVTTAQKVGTKQEWAGRIKIK